LRANRLFAVCCLVVFSAAPVVAKQLDGVPRERHAWGQFPVGSWKIVRTETELLDPRGRVVSENKTVTTTKLVDADSEGYTLQVSVVMEVAGKRVQVEPQLIRRGYNGEAQGQRVSVRRIREARFRIAGSDVPCEVRQITIAADGGQRVMTVHFSDDFAPHVLRRETATFDNDGNKTDMQSEVEVVAVDDPQYVRGEERLTTSVQVTHNNGTASTQTLEVHCQEVPGGVVSHTSKETDAEGKVVRRSTLTLVDYGIGNGENEETRTARRGFRNRRVNRR
jgi:hypothetical protein